jgi:hypothetical protein
MQFFLYEIVARVVASYLLVDCYRTIRGGFAERKIAVFNSDHLDWYPYPDLHRDSEPIRFWITMGLQFIALIACTVVAIFGWRHSA